MIVYKVARREKTENGYSSRTKFKSLINSKGSVKYRIGEETEAIIGELLVFTDIRSAVEFLHTIREGKTILECEAEDGSVSIQKSVLMISASFDEYVLRDFWENPFTPSSELFLNNRRLAPPGTHKTKKLKVIRTIPVKKIRSFLQCL